MPRGRAFLGNPLRPLLSLLGHCDPQAPSPELLIIEPLDGLNGRRGVRELYEREAPRPTTDPVGWEKYLHKLADLRKHGFEFALSGVIIQVANKDS